MKKIEAIIKPFKLDEVKQALSEINGDFSIIWIPKNENHFYIARDPFGQRPLYYSKFGEGWVFSSQPSS